MLAVDGFPEAGEQIVSTVRVESSTASLPSSTKSSDGGNNIVARFAQRGDGAHVVDASSGTVEQNMSDGSDELPHTNSSPEKHRGGRPKGSKDSYKRSRHLKMPRDKESKLDSIELKAQYRRDRVRILSKEKKLKESIDKANHIIAEQKMLGITQQSANRQIKAISDVDKVLVGRLRRVEKRLLMKESSLPTQSYPTKLAATLFRGMVQAIYVDLDNLTNQKMAPVEIVEQSLAGLFATFREQFKTIAQELVSANASHGAINDHQTATISVPKSTGKATKKASTWVAKKTLELEGAAAMTMVGFSQQHLLSQLQQENEDDDDDSYM